jgi:hypothetical protein
MKKIYTKPNTSLVPQPRSFTRRIKQMFAGLLKYQDPEFIQRLQDLEYKVEILERESVQQGKKSK